MNNKTNSKHVKELIKHHILDCMYDFSENKFPTFEDAAEHLKSEFERVANHEFNMRRIPNNQERFHDYMQGIPFHFEYRNEGIKNYLNSLGINKRAIEFDTDKSYKLYTHLIFKAITSTLTHSPLQR